jgi:hypothetical protein
MSKIHIQFRFKKIRNYTLRFVYVFIAAFYLRMIWQSTSMDMGTSTSSLWTSADDAASERTKDEIDGDLYETTNSFNFSKLPKWMVNYSDWHSQQLQLLSKSNWQSNTLFDELEEYHKKPGCSNYSLFGSMLLSKAIFLTKQSSTEYSINAEYSVAFSRKIQKKNGRFPF